MNIDIATDRATPVSLQRSAWSQVLDLGCEVSRYRVLGGSYLDLVERARLVADVAAGEGLPMESPLTELFKEQRQRGYNSGPTLGWEYARAYKISDDRIDPSKYFTLSYENAFITIESLGVAGGDGEVSFNSGYAPGLFKCARDGRERSYDQWLHDHYPVGGQFLLQRIDNDPIDAEYGALRLLAGDVHPCRGFIQFGEPLQELDQLAAFVKLHAQVLALFAAEAPSAQDRAATAERAKALIESHGQCFMPDSGYCAWCRADVTASCAHGSALTGCPKCGHTWCE